MISEKTIPEQIAAWMQHTAELLCEPDTQLELTYMQAGDKHVLLLSGSGVKFMMGKRGVTLEGLRTVVQRMGYRHGLLLQLEVAPKEA